MNLRRECLETALEYTNHDRNADHGDPEDNFRNIAAFWNAHLQTRYPFLRTPTAYGDAGFELDATDVALMMALMKAARLSFNPGHRDSWIDLAGYAACGMDVTLRHKKKARPAAQSAEEPTPTNARSCPPVVGRNETCPPGPHVHTDGRVGGA